MPDALSPTPQELPEEIEKAIASLEVEAWRHGYRGGHRETPAREALTAAILSRLGEAEARREEAQGAPFGTGYSRAEPFGGSDD